jgi:phosphoglycerate dehydrogenase-like enzyme
MNLTRIPWFGGIVAVLALAGCMALPATQPEVPFAPPGSGESIGSLRNARVAYPMPDPKVRLTYLAGELTQAERTQLELLAPNVRVLSGLTRQSALEHAAEAHGADARFATSEFIARAPHLVWVQAMSAGVDHILESGPLAKSDRIVLTNMRAVHGPAIADHAMAMLLTLTRNMKAHAANQAAGRWEGDAGGHPIALQGRTMLVVGLGGIGTEIAQRAHGFGMHVIATRRTAAPAPAYVERVGGPDALAAMLPEADVVAICVPLTGETRGLMRAREFAAMKPGAYLINIARGPIVDTGAMMESLRSGRLAGACLDVTDPEPLPADHPLWHMDGVVITPHTAAEAELTRERRWSLLCENIRRFGAGEPLLNVVDPRAGY